MVGSARPDKSPTDDNLRVTCDSLAGGGAGEDECDEYLSRKARARPPPSTPHHRLIPRSFPSAAMPGLPSLFACSAAYPLEATEEERTSEYAEAGPVWKGFLPLHCVVLYCRLWTQRSKVTSAGVEAAVFSPTPMSSHHPMSSGRLPGQSRTINQTELWSNGSPSTQSHN